MLENSEFTSIIGKSTIGISTEKKDVARSQIQQDEQALHQMQENQQGKIQ